MADGTTAEFIRVQAALAGRYSLQRELGRGGMGIVYLAHDVALERPVALKLLQPHLASRPALKQRFLTEARTAARLSHPNIIPIFSVDEVQDLVFFVMAFVDGETLGERIRQRGPVAPSELARILREVGWGLAYAHAQGVVHRDVKADNILLERATGRALLADFGIARVAQAGGEAGAGDLTGTAEYMSPEQAGGAAADQRSDIYSLGVVAWYALSGRLPFEAASPAAVLAKHLTLQPAPVAQAAPGVPAKLGDAVDRCLAKDPADRFPTAEALADAVGTALASRPEAPLPIRRFIRSGGELTQNLVFITYFQSVLAFFAGMSALTHEALGVNVLLGLAGIGLIADPFVAAGMLAKMRRLLRAGYTREDLLAAWQRELQHGEHERQLEHGAAPDGLERAARWGFPLGLAAVAAGTAAALAGWSGLANVLGLTGWTGGFFCGVFALFRHDGRTALSQRITGWFVESRLGRWAFKLAGAGLDRTALATLATHRPTELSIGMAVDALFEALPKETRQHLADLPAVVRGLETDAARIRRHLEQLEDAAAAEGGGGGGDPVLSDRREAAEAALEKARASAKERLAEAVTALETIRLDLLRLTAGTASVDSLTTDLADARALCAGMDRLLEARGEIEEELRHPTPV